MIILAFKLQVQLQKIAYRSVEFWGDDYIMQGNILWQTRLKK